MLGTLSTAILTAIVTCVAPVSQSKCPGRPAMLEYLLDGALQSPKGEALLDPASIRCVQEGSDREYFLPNGLRLRLHDGLRMARALPFGRALVYQDNYCVMVLDGRAHYPRTVYRSRLKAGMGATPAWSPDGRHCFHFFDCHLQLVAIDTSTSEMRSLTNYKVHRNYKGGVHFEPIITQPFVYDAAHRRLLYIEQDYGPPDDAQLVAVDVESGERTTISKRFDLSDWIREWCVSLRQGRIYTNVRAGKSIDVWSLEGDLIDRIEFPECATLFYLVVSRDARFVITVPERRVYELDPRTEVCRLPQGRIFAWSPGGKSLAFTRSHGELWLHDLSQGQTQRLAYIVPSDDALAWWGGLKYGHTAVWSGDGNMLAATLYEYSDRVGRKVTITLLIDLKAKRVVVLPCRAYGISWSPVPHPFPVPLLKSQ